MNILRVLLPKSGVSFLEDSATIRNGLEKMRYHGFSAVPVINKEGVYVGTITEGDFLWYLMDHAGDDLREMEKHRVSEIIHEDRNRAVHASATVEDVMNKLLSQNFVPVVDDRGVFVGIVTRKAVLGILTSPVNRKNE